MSEHFYSRTPNTLPELEGSYRGVYHSKGLVSFDELAADTASSCPNLVNAEGVKLVIRSTMGVAARHVARNERVRMDDLGLSIGLDMGGSLPSLDAQPGEENPIRARIWLDDDIKSAFRGIVPVRVDDSEVVPKLFAEEDEASHAQGTIVGTGVFILTGRNLSASGEGEGVQLVDAVGATHVATVTEGRRGQRVEAHFATAPAAGKATLTLLTHGFLTPDGRLHSLAKTVTVLTGETPPVPPTPTGPTVTAINEGTFHAGGGNVVTGANMRFADAFPGNHLVIKDSEGTDVEAMISTDDTMPITETSFALNIDEATPLTDGAPYVFEFSMLDEGGQPVTVTQTARWSAG